MNLDAETRILLKRAVNIRVRIKQKVQTEEVEWRPGVCRQCNHSFTPNPKAAKQFYCSKLCKRRGQAARERGEYAAHIDGKVVGTCALSDCENDVIIGKFARTAKRFCSKRCARRDWARRKAVESRHAAQAL